MAASTPAMIINLPPPRPDDIPTPSELPGTPNSGTTTMSELSTVAIKDGHRGHMPHGHHNPMDAERADRISRLAGLDRVAPRPTSSTHTPNPAVGYFDGNNQPQIHRERSTVGSASATGSVGGRTTWASGSNVEGEDGSTDKMSEDGERSVGGFSDEVGFGEGAQTPARAGGMSPVVGKVVPNVHGGSGLREVTGVSQHDARMIDGVSYDGGDTTMTSDPNEERGAETSERLMRERLGRGQ